MNTALTISRHLALLYRTILPTLIVSGLLLCLAPSARATRPWTPEEIKTAFEQSHMASQPRFELPRSRRGWHALDDPAYFAHYQMLCDFLVSMQFTAAGPNHGGMIEGESEPDYSIIETDNTQEAIRIWSQYAIWTGDTTTYGAHIHMAQGYCQRYPAWRETDTPYYAIHNCGWGFEAERIYRAAYADTSWTWYADSCAWWVIAHPLPIDPNSTDLGQLDPLAEGLGIGGFYPHAVYRQRSDWQTFCINEARLLRRWFESNPARLNQNEVWALCGGTALWGICESLFTLYPDSGQIWLAQYGSQLDVWQANGSWNNASNTWYCNAQHVCFEITQDSTYWENAVFITDSLIALDTDGDGGIPPAWNYPDTNDHSWVSAYMGWMGMERIINSTPAHDVGVEAFASPLPSLPHLAGDPMTVAVRLANRGRTEESGTLTVTGANYSASTPFSLSVGTDSAYTLATSWVVPDDDNIAQSSYLAAQIESDEDEVPANDTLSQAFDIRRQVQVFGHVSDADNPNLDLPAQIDIYHESYPDSIWTTVFAGADGNYTTQARPLMEGTNRFNVEPNVQFMAADTEATVTHDASPVQLNFALRHTDLALIDDDVNQTYETWFLSSLDSFPDLRVRLWNRESAELNSLDGVPTVIWFCGNDSTTTLLPSDQALLQNYLTAGGHLLLTGQNIPEDDAAAPFLNTALHCSLRTANTNIRGVTGVSGNPISDGVFLVLSGQGGAWNQTSPSSIYILEGGTQILQYSAGDDEPCGVSGEFGSGRFIFLSFGLEAASGANHSTTRRAFLNRCFAWFSDSSSAAESTPELPSRIWLAQNYPNPFNPSTTIQFVAPAGGRPFSICVYNVLGQKVRTLFSGVSVPGIMSVSWDGLTEAGTNATSGFYVYRLETDGTQISRMLQLIR
jgi:hypothetical protein